MKDVTKVTSGLEVENPSPMFRRQGANKEEEPEQFQGNRETMAATDLWKACQSTVPVGTDLFNNITEHPHGIIFHMTGKEGYASSISPWVRRLVWWRRPSLLRNILLVEARGVESIGKVAS